MSGASWLTIAELAALANPKTEAFENYSNLNGHKLTIAGAYLAEIIGLHGRYRLEFLKESILGPCFQPSSATQKVEVSEDGNKGTEGHRAKENILCCISLYGCGISDATKSAFISITTGLGLDHLVTVPKDDIDLLYTNQNVEEIQWKL